MENEIDRTFLTLAVMGAVIAPSYGVALAGTLNGGPRPDAPSGADDSDRISGGGGPDSVVVLGAADVLCGDRGVASIAGGASNDALNGGSGADDLHGGSEDDVTHSQGLNEGGVGDSDTVACRPSRDRVTADLEDRAAADCERVVAGVF